MMEVLSYRNPSIDLQSKSVDWFLYDSDRRPERVILYLNSVLMQENTSIKQDHFKIHVSLVVISCVILN